MNTAPGDAGDTADVRAEELVVTSVAEGVSTIRLNRPARLNALGAGIVAELRDAVTRTVEDGARVLIFRGTGRAFCVGADLKERSAMTEGARLAHNAAINDAFDTIANAPVPTIAILNGIALGGGCELALACDFRWAAPEATIGLTEARLGVMPGAGGTQRLPRLIGSARALELMLSGEPIDARRAEAIGLIQRLVELDQLDQTALDFAVRLAARSPRAAAVTKKTVYQGVDLSLEAALAVERAALHTLFAHPDYAEGLTAFAEGREPRFAAPRSSRYDKHSQI